MLKLVVSSFLIGAIFGILLGITIKYPITITNVEKLHELCINHQDWDHARLSISGKIFDVVCKDGALINLEQKSQFQQQPPPQE